MADRLSQKRRSELMARIVSKHTRPERIARSLIHRLGYRFTINGPKNKTLPGRPDIVLPGRKTVIFVHGCFWHRHSGCKAASSPKSNVAYWQQKFARNIERDQQAEAALTELNWRVITLWECELKQLDALAARLVSELPRQNSGYLPESIDDERLVAEVQSAYRDRS